MRRVIVGLLAVALAGMFYVFVARPFAHRAGAGMTAMSEAGRSAVEGWCRTQIERIANDHLAPDVRFERFEYTFPATATLHGVTFVADGTAFIEVGSLSLTLTEAPRKGQPIVISSMRLVDPVVRLATGEDGRLVGFADIVLPGPGVVYEDGGSTQPSDVFAIRRFEIENGQVRYESPNGREMWLDNLTFDMTSSPADEGWYALDATLDRAPLLNATVDGRINIDSGVLDIAASRIELVVGPDQYHRLPPPVQALAEEHHVTGRMEAAIDGQLPLGDMTAASLGIQLSLTDARSTFGEYVLPVESLEVTGRLSEMQLDLDPIDAEVFEGSVHMSWSSTLDGGVPTSVTLDARRLSLASSLTPALHEPPRYSGLMDLNGTVSGLLDVVPSSLDGTGTIAIDQADLLGSSTVARLVDAMKLLGAKREEKERASADLTLTGEHLALSNIEVIGNANEIRGDGRIAYDSTIDFRLRVKALKKLGPVGAVLGVVTDNITVYNVTGTVQDPKAKLRPLGRGSR